MIHRIENDHTRFRDIVRGRIKQDLKRYVSHGELIGSQIPYRFVDEGVLGLQYERRSKRLLFWKKDALGVLDLSEERDGEGVFETIPKPVWIYQRGERIEQAFSISG